MVAVRNSFHGEVFYVGLDVHKRSWNVTVRSNHMKLKTFSMEPSPKKLFATLSKNWPGGKYVSVYEAGFCGFWIHKQLCDLGIENIVIHAADVPTTHKEKVTKTDKVDSGKLARELENGTLNAIYIPNGFHQQIRSLCRLRHTYTIHSARIKNRIKGTLNYYGIPTPTEGKNWSYRYISEIKRCAEDIRTPGSSTLLFSLDELLEQRKRVLDVTIALRKCIKEYKDQLHTVDLIRSVPGIGFVTAMTFYTEIMDMKRFPSLDTLASFTGLCPACHSSGEKNNITGLTPRRNRYLRHLIIEAAWIAARTDPALFKSFTELSKRMKKTNAIIRIAKKLLNRIRYVWINQEYYKCQIYE